MVKRTDKPIVGFGRMSYQMTPEAVEAQKAAGFPFLQGLEPTVRALNALWFHAARRGKRPPTPPPAPPSDLSPATLDATLARIRHHAAEKPRGRDRGGGRSGRRGHRISGRAENPLARHPAQDRSRRRRARSAQQRRRAQAADALTAAARKAQSGREDRRLPGAGDGVRRRGDRRRAHRPALRPAAAGRRRRRPGRACQGRGAAPAAGRAGTT